MIIEGDSKTIAAAYIKARAEMSATVKKDKKGVYGQYATLAAIVEATTDALAKHGLAIMQEASVNDGGVSVDTWLIHESGATIHFSPLPMPLDKRTPQAVGSAITYARRYQLAAVCGLAPDDDDGQAAQDAHKVKATLRQVEPSTGEIMEAAANLPTVDDIIFERDEWTPPTDEEETIIHMWQSKQDAFAWSVNTGACKNIFEAENSMKKIARDNKMALTPENKQAIFLATLRHWNEKLAQQEAVPA